MALEINTLKHGGFCLILPTPIKGFVKRIVPRRYRHWFKADHDRRFWPLIGVPDTMKGRTELVS